jgi:hypothetical protein
LSPSASPSKLLFCSQCCLLCMNTTLTQIYC